MKKAIITILSLAAVLLSGCEKPIPAPKAYQVDIQLKSGDAAFAREGVTVTVSSGSSDYTIPTNAEGKASFKLVAGSYNAAVSASFLEGGVKLSYNGSVAFAVTEGLTETLTVELVLVQSKSSQIIIKELYTGGCLDNSGTKAYLNDSYIILYNNSAEEADASEVVFSVIDPANGHAPSKYYTDGKLLYEDAGWLPAYSAIWWFKESVRIPAYSQIVIAIFGAIDHTQTYTNSVNLSNAAYYWMSNSEISTIYKMAKYVADDAIPTSHYLTTSPISAGTAWTVSINSPALYIGKMDQASVKALSTNKEAYDMTSGLKVAKFPQEKVLDAIEVFSSANLDKSNARFPKSINTGAVKFENQKGYTLYRNVDKEATEALAENAGKLVYEYAGGTLDIDPVNGSTDPSGIDAEASIAKGARIIYMDTNNSEKDFHQRKVASIKK